MGWGLLLVGIAINVGGVLGISLAQRSSLGWLAIIGYLSYFFGFFVITLSFKHLNVGMAYALWSGLGCLLIFGAGVLLFDESLSPPKLFFFGSIVLGVVGISVTG